MKNNHLFSVTPTLLFEKQVSKSYWEEVVLTIAYLTNRVSFRVFWIQKSHGIVYLRS